MPKDTSGTDLPSTLERSDNHAQVVEALDKANRRATAAARRS